MNLNQQPIRWRRHTALALAAAVLASLILFPLTALHLRDDRRSAATIAATLAASQSARLVDALSIDARRAAYDIADSGWGPAFDVATRREAPLRTEITALYFIGTKGKLRQGLRRTRGETLVSTNLLPTALTGGPSTVLGKALDAALRRHQGAAILSMAGTDSPYGLLYLFAPSQRVIRAGAVVALVDGASLFAQALQTTGSSQAVVATSSLALDGKAAPGTVGVSHPSATSADQSIVGGRRPVASPLAGAGVVGSAATLSSISSGTIVVATTLPSLAAMLVQSGMLLWPFLLLIAGAVALWSLYRDIRVATAAGIAVRRASLQQEARVLARVLDQVRGGDLTTRVPLRLEALPALQEVGVSANLLIDAYAALVGRVDEALNAVLEGIGRIDEETRAAYALVSVQREEMSLASGILDVLDVVTRTVQESSRLLWQGQRSADRCAGALEQTESAALLASNEIQTIHEQVVHLASLAQVARVSVQDLDTQAANAITLTRHAEGDEALAAGKRIVALAALLHGTLDDLDKAVGSATAAAEGARSYGDDVARHAAGGAEAARAIHEALREVAAAQASLAGAVEGMTIPRPQQASSAERATASATRLDHILDASRDQTAHVRLAAIALQGAVASLVSTTSAGPLSHG